MIVLLVVFDANGDPVVVAIAPDHGPLNVILSIYGKRNGLAWAAREIAHAKNRGQSVYDGKGFAASLPQPPAAEAASSSNGPIPVDGTTKPRREILSLRKKSAQS